MLSTKSEYSITDFVDTCIENITQTLMPIYLFLHSSSFRDSQ